MPVISLQHTYIIFRGWKKFELLSRHYSPMKCLIAAKSKTQSSKNTNSLFQIPEAPTIARYQLGVDRRTSPIVFLSKMLIRGAPRILGHSLCNKRKLKKDLQFSHSNKCYMCLPSLVPSLQQWLRTFFNDQWSSRRGSIETFRWFLSQSELHDNDNAWLFAQYQNDNQPRDYCTLLVDASL